MIHPDEERLEEIVFAEYKKLHNSKIPEICSQDIAAKAYTTIDPQGIAPPPVRLAALLTLEELASKLLFIWLPELPLDAETWAEAMEALSQKSRS
jgi:hypothetical protein